MRSLKNDTIVLRPDDNGTSVAYIPAIVGCHAWGLTPEEAQAELVHVFEMIRVTTRSLAVTLLLITSRELLFGANLLLA